MVTETPSKRLVVVSNRLPTTATVEDGQVCYKASSGGLASGLSAYLEKESQVNGSEDSDYLWVGWPGNSYDKQYEVGIREELKAAHSAWPVFLSEKQMEGFYEGFSNGTLWPLFHYFPSYCRYEDSLWETYVEVNRKFANAVAEVARPEDTIWVHDYQLMLVPQMLRERLPNASIGFFLHIPFPSHDVFRLLPRAWGRALLEGLMGADLVGFHTYDYTHHFLRSVLRILGYDHNLGTVPVGERTVRADTFPMGIEYSKYHDAALMPEVSAAIEEFKRVMGDRKSVLSVDRLDYTKGILNRLRGFELFLELNPQWREEVKLILIVVPSRETVNQYDSMKHQIDEAVGRINGQYGSVSWTPIVYNYRSVPFEDLVAAYSASDAALVTPLRDGMNLVAKEYVACRTSGTGVLILSEMAGAANELTEALLINPNSIIEIAEALKTALEMPADEQSARLDPMQQRLRRYDVVRWAEDFLNLLDKSRHLEATPSVTLITPDIRKEILQDFQNAKRRMILSDYDGTLVGFAGDPMAVKPSPRLKEIICSLANLPDTECVIISGRIRQTLQEWLGDCNVSIVAEHGACVKRARQDWHDCAPAQVGWKQELRPILETYVDRLPGSFVEEKQFCLVWHYRKAHPELGPVRAQELTDSLQGFTSNLSNVQVLPGNKVVELRDPSHNKGTVASQLVADYQPDFILAVGDDVTDEDLFKSLPDHAVTIKVGRPPTAAKYRLRWYGDVLALFEELAKAETAAV